MLHVMIIAVSGTITPAMPLHENAKTQLAPLTLSAVVPGGCRTSQLEKGVTLTKDASPRVDIGMLVDA